MLGKEKNCVPFARLEHAYRDDRNFTVSTESPDGSMKPYRNQKGVFAGPCFHVYDGSMAVDVGEVAVIYRGAALTSARRVSGDESYVEAIGLAPGRQEWQDTLPKSRITFRGYRSPFPWDLLEVLKDNRYRISPSPDPADRGLVFLECPAIDRLWLDPARGYAVVRRERHWDVGKPLNVRITNFRARPFGREVWLPMLVTIQYFGRPESSPDLLVAEEILNVDLLSLDPPESLFHINLKAGTFAVDVEHEWSGRLPPLNDAALKEFLNSPQVVRAAPARWTWQRAALIAASAILLVAAITLFAWRRYRARTA